MRWVILLDTLNCCSSATLPSVWSNGNIGAQEFKFIAEFTAPSFTKATDIVIRFYRKSRADEQAGKGSLSLIIPGKLAAHYYDKEGRRIQKIISP